MRCLKRRMMICRRLFLKETRTDHTQRRRSSFLGEMRFVNGARSPMNIMPEEDSGTHSMCYATAKTGPFIADSLSVNSFFPEAVTSSRSLARVMLT